MKKTLKGLCMGFLDLTIVVTALSTTPVHAESKQYWTESAEGIVSKNKGNQNAGNPQNRTPHRQQKK